MIFEFRTPAAKNMRKNNQKHKKLKVKRRETCINKKRERHDRKRLMSETKVQCDDVLDFDIDQDVNPISNMKHNDSDNNRRNSLSNFDDDFHENIDVISNLNDFVYTYDTFYRSSKKSMK